MSTTTPSRSWTQTAHVMVLGLVLALGIGVLGSRPGAAWLGFALAAMYAETRRGRAAVAGCIDVRREHGR